MATLWKLPSLSVFSTFLSFLTSSTLSLLTTLSLLQGSTLWAVENKNIIAISSTLSKPQQPKPGRETLSPDRLDLRTWPAGQISALLGPAAPSLWAQDKTAATHRYRIDTRTLSTVVSTFCRPACPDRRQVVVILSSQIVRPITKPLRALWGLWGTI